jgi:hypothetical protein
MTKYIPIIPSQTRQDSLLVTLRTGSSTSDDRQKPGMISKNFTRSKSSIRSLNNQFKMHSSIPVDEFALGPANQQGIRIDL